MLMFERIECSPLALHDHHRLACRFRGREAFESLKEIGTHIDRHLLIRWQTHVSHLRDISSSLHVSGITTRSENDCDLSVRVDVI